MKLTLVAALISIVAFLGCAPENRNNSSDPVPDDIGFAPQPGKNLSQQDYSNLKEYFKNNKSETPAKFLVESTHGAELSKQSLEYQAAIAQLKGTCTVRPSTTTSSGNTSDVFSSVGGGGCGIDFLSTFHTVIDTSKFDQHSGAGVITANFSGAEAEDVKTVALQALSHFVSSKLSFNGNMAANSVNNIVKMIFNLSYGGTFNMQDRALQLAGHASVHVKDSRVHVAAHLSIQGLPTDLNISVEGRGYSNRNSTNMNNLRFTVYVNGTQLDVGTLNDLSKTIDPDGTKFKVNSDGTVTFLGSSTLQTVGH
jgi:hypothetical protein